MPRPRKTRTTLLTKSEQMARVRSKDTEPEQALRRALWAAGLRYRLRLKLPGTPDIVFPRAKVAVFIDGCFWHGCPVHYTRPATNSAFWSRKLGVNQERDRRVDRDLAEMGWTAVRVWEHEVASELDGVIGRILPLVQCAEAERRAVRRTSTRPDQARAIALDTAARVPKRSKP